MSDTPRTDAFLKAGDGARVVRCSYSDLERLVLSVADFARVLERELAELRDLYNVTRGLIPGAKEAVRPEEWRRDDVIKYARALIAKHNYVRGMADDDPQKGPGNYLIDALDSLLPQEQR